MTGRRRYKGAELLAAFLPVVLLLAVCGGCSPQAASSVLQKEETTMLYVKDFHNGEAFYDKAIRNALREADKQKDEPVTLVFPAGDIPIRVPIALDKQENLHLKGENSRLLVQDSCSLLEIRESRNITVSGFTVDYTVVNFTMGEIRECNGREFTVRINEGYPLTEEMVVGSFVEFDPLTGAPRRDGNALYPFGNVEYVRLVSEEKRLITIRFREDCRPAPAGTRVVISQAPFDVPGILFDGCNNLAFRDLCFYMVPGMGFFGTNTDNVTLERVDMRLNRDTDRLFSACRDGIHLMSCAGDLIIRDCYMENLGDDGLNVHANWLEARAVRDAYTVELDVVGTNTNLAMNNRHRDGDVFQIRDRNMQVLGTVTAKSVQVGQSRMTVTFDQPLTEAMQQGYFYNQSRSPRLLFENNTVINSRAHGVLVQTDNAAVVRGNRFINNYYAGIKINVTTDESVPADNLVLEDNYIGGSSYFPELGDILVDSWAGEKAPGVFRNLIIRNNTIEKTADVGAAIRIFAADGVLLEGNRLSNTAEPPRPVEAGDKADRLCGIWIGQSRNVTLRRNSLSGQTGPEGWLHLLEGADRQTLTVEEQSASEK